MAKVTPDPLLPVTFKGGPLGGECRQIDVQSLKLGTLKVPVQSRPGSSLISSSASLPSPSPTTYTEEQYEIRPGPSGYEAVWVNKSADVVEKLADANEEVKRLNRIVERLICLFDDDDERLQILGWLASLDADGS